MFNTSSEQIEACETTPPILLAGLEHVLQRPSRPQNPDSEIHKTRLNCPVLSNVIAPGIKNIFFRRKH